MADKYPGNTGCPGFNALLIPRDDEWDCHAQFDISFGEWRVSLQIGPKGCNQNNDGFSFLPEKTEDVYPHASSWSKDAQLRVTWRGKGFGTSPEHDGVFGGVTPDRFAQVLGIVATHGHVPMRVRMLLNEIEDL